MNATHRSACLQKYNFEEVDAAGFDKLKKDGTLNFGVLPALKTGNGMVVEHRSAIETPTSLSFDPYLC